MSLPHEISSIKVPQIIGAVVDGHLLALALVSQVAVALIHELVQGEATVH